MKAAIIVPNSEFRDEAVSMSKLIFGKWGVDAHVIAESMAACRGSHGAVYKAEGTIDALDPNAYNAIILVDGEGINTQKLYDNRKLADTLKKFNAAEKPICAIGNAVKILARANVIDGKKIAVPDNEEIQRIVGIYRGLPTKEKLVFDKNIVTLRDDDSIQQALSLILAHLGMR